MDKMTDTSTITTDTETAINNFKQSLLDLNEEGISLISKQNIYNSLYLEDADILREQMKDMIVQAVSNGNI